MNTELKVTLSEPLKVARRGEQELMFDITLNAPTAKARTYIIRLKQLFLKAMTSMPKGQEETKADAAEAESTITGQQVIALMYLSDANVTQFHELMRELIIMPGVAAVDDVKMTGHLYDQMDLDDTEKLIGEYFASFLVPSLMKSLNS